MLFLGARRQDAVKLGPKNLSTVLIPNPGPAGPNTIKVPIITYVPRKTTYKRPTKAAL